MMLTDPIADMLTRIRNGLQARHPAVTMPSSKLKVAVAEVLRDEGYIQGFQELEESPQKKLRIELKYVDKNVPVVTGIKRVSKPGLRVYSGATEMPRVYGGLGVAIVSTSKGVMSGRRARRMGVGGEVLCHVW
ncbi:MAG TPA: 30S ribosomal protein S8 [Chloroflexota bacterium]|nr:30S ribosomal protein S8 [Chloroflexota bacterium]